MNWSFAEDVVRETKTGKVRGDRIVVLNVSVDVYKGIPYAEAPVGHLRFKPPQPRIPWNGVYDARKPGNSCSQYRSRGIPKEPFDYTEDCLRLNVWTPTTAENVPVLVWIHGGGFTYGSSSSKYYNGMYLAAKTGYVVASMNYRLGIFGFLNANSPDAPGNMGLLDQHLALIWIQENIAAFGGDASMVTIFGESAGSMSVHCHVLSPMSKGLFRRAIMMSGFMNTIDFSDSVHESTEKGNKVAEIVGCAKGENDLNTNPESVLQCLREKPAEELALASGEVVAPKVFSFFPSFHDTFLPKVPLQAIDRGFFSEVDVLAGVTSDEGALVYVYPPKDELIKETLDKRRQESIKLSLYDEVASWTKAEIPEMKDYYERKAQPGDLEALRRMYVDYLSDRVFNCPLKLFAEKHTARGNSVYMYIFGHKSSKSWLPKWMGVPHWLEVPYFLGAPLGSDADLTHEDPAVSQAVIEMIASFALKGVPELPNKTSWPKYSKDHPVWLYLAHNNYTTVEEYRKTECELWRKFI